MSVLLSSTSNNSIFMSLQASILKLVQLIVTKQGIAPHVRSLPSELCRSNDYWDYNVGAN